MPRLQEKPDQPRLLRERKPIMHIRERPILQSLELLLSLE